VARPRCTCPGPGYDSGMTNEEPTVNATLEEIMQTEEMLHDRGGVEGASITGPGEPLTEDLPDSSQG